MLHSKNYNSSIQCRAKGKPQAWESGQDQKGKEIQLYLVNLFYSVPVVYSYRYKEIFREIFWETIYTISACTLDSQNTITYQRLKIPAVKTKQKLFNFL